jgi:hypothetical protein
MNPEPFLCLNLPRFHSLRKSLMEVYEKFCGCKQNSTELNDNLQV